MENFDYYCKREKKFIDPNLIYREESYNPDTEIGFDEKEDECIIEIPLMENANSNLNDTIYNLTENSILEESCNLNLEETELRIDTIRENLDEMKFLMNNSYEISNEQLSKFRESAIDAYTRELLAESQNLISDIASEYLKNYEFLIKENCAKLSESELKNKKKEWDKDKKRCQEACAGVAACSTGGPDSGYGDKQDEQEIVIENFSELGDNISFDI